MRDTISADVILAQDRSDASSLCKVPQIAGRICRFRNSIGIGDQNVIFL